MILFNVVLFILHNNCISVDIIILYIYDFI